MRGRRRADLDATGCASTREYVTPLNTASVWALIVMGGTLWPPLTHLSGRLAFFGALLLVTLAVTALHEAGHLLAGWLVRLPCQALTVGLVTVRRERRAPGKGLIWDVNRSWQRLAGCVEREVVPAPGVRTALTVTALGGPLASIVAGMLLLAAPAPWDGIGYVSLFVGLFNAVPTALFGQLSDGMIVWRLWSHRPADMAWRAQFCDIGGAGHTAGA